MVLLLPLLDDVAGPDPGDDDGGSWAKSISPVQATSVWSHGVASDERCAKESKRADWPRRGLRCCARRELSAERAER